MSDKPELEPYLETWSQELTAQQSRVRLLIGNAHWLSDGHHKEYILINLLKKYLPTTKGIVRGFIRAPLPASDISGECDILVFDESRQAPWFKTEQMAVVPPASVQAVIEVKSTSTSSTQTDSLSGLCHGASILTKYVNQDSYWLGVYFFDSDTSDIQSFADGLLKRTIDVITKMRLSFERRQIITAAVHENWFAVIEVPQSRRWGKSSIKAKVKVFKSGRLTTAFFLRSLLSYVSLPGGDSAGHLESTLASLDLPCVLAKEQ